MNSRLLELASRRGELKARIATQRQTLTQQARPLEPVFGLVDKVVVGVDWVKQHPQVVGVGVAVVALLKPSRAWRWAKRAAFVWRGWQGARNYLENGR
jgi:DNA-binding transcriptional regulator LsrR (DeoR family)